MDEILSAESFKVEWPDNKCPVCWWPVHFVGEYWTCPLYRRSLCRHEQVPESTGVCSDCGLFVGIQV
jgi:hypothetical protein